MQVNKPERTNQNKYLKLQSNHGTGKFVSALCLQSRFHDLLAYAIKFVYTWGALLLQLNLQNHMAIWLVT